MDFPPNQTEDFEDRLRGEIPSGHSFEDFATAQEALAFTNYCLSTVYSDKGIVYWWNKSNRLLNDRTALDVWVEDPQRVIDLAVQLAVF